MRKKKDYEEKVALVWDGNKRFQGVPTTFWEKRIKCLRDDKKKA